MLLKGGGEADLRCGLFAGLFACRLGVASERLTEPATQKRQGEAAGAGQRRAKRELVGVAHRSLFLGLGRWFEDGPG